MKHWLCLGHLGVFACLREGSELVILELPRQIGIGHKKWYYADKVSQRNCATKILPNLLVNCPSRFASEPLALLSTALALFRTFFGSVHMNFGFCESVIAQSEWFSRKHPSRDAKCFWPKNAWEYPQKCPHYMASRAFKQALLALRDVTISSQICGSKLQRVLHIRWRMLAAHSWAFQIFLCAFSFCSLGGEGGKSILEGGSAHGMGAICRVGAPLGTGHGWWPYEGHFQSCSTKTEATPDCLNVFHLETNIIRTSQCKSWLQSDLTNGSHFAEWG